MEENGAERKFKLFNSVTLNIKNSQMRETKVTKTSSKIKAFAVKMMCSIYVHHSQFMYAYKKIHITRCLCSSIFNFIAMI